MAIPLALGLMAGLGGLKGLLGNRAAATDRENQWAAEEDKRKREQLNFTLTQLPQLQGAEQRKTMGNLFARGMWGNFGRDPKTGAARSPEMQAVMSDPWVYRDQSKLAALSPYAAPLPKPKGGGTLGFLGDVLGGAASGAASYYASQPKDSSNVPGENPFMGGGGGGGSSSYGGASASGSSGGFGPPYTLSALQPLQGLGFQGGPSYIG